jgi:tripartite-type tricarboxylate transporter receptor subunit TctC
VRQFACVLCLLLYVASVVSNIAVAAQSPERYPSKPVRIILPFPAGGPSDLVARVFADRLGARLNQQFVVDNRGGAAGINAGEIAARAAPDGYTLLLGSVGMMTINPALYPKLPYDPLRDFDPVSLLSASPYLLAAAPNLPVRSVKDLIALAKASPGRLNYAAGGAGTGNHLSAELFKLLAGIDMVHIPYKGSSAALADVVSGQVQLWFVNVLVAAPHAKSGRIKALAVTSGQRSVSAPDGPTVAESGLKGYETTSWHGVLVPAKTPPAIVERLHAELAAIAKQPEVRTTLGSQGADMIGSTASEFAAHLRVETAKWRKVITSGRIKAE